MAGSSGLVPTNLVMGPARIYLGTFDPTLANEPALTALNTTPAASSWFDVGMTNGGTTVSVAPTYSPFNGDQLVDDLGANLTGRKITVKVSMTEMTLTSLQNAWNTSAPTTGAGYAYLEPAYQQSASQPAYAALLIDGIAPRTAVGATQRRRVILRKVLPTGNTDLTWDKTNQQVLAVEYQAFFVSETVAPFRVIDPAVS
ncbi:hypothetical protein AB0383_48700 [Amycolatopsis sp. NPDC051373]|uniref:hypothetical protein n=1 Tax=Amycolatopsis sp. NPDC051373 TaxID=3155801 RepID=UPI00344D0180